MIVVETDLSISKSDVPSYPRKTTVAEMEVADIVEIEDFRPQEVEGRIICPK